MSPSKIKFTHIWQKYMPLKVVLCMRDLQLSCNSSISTEHYVFLPDTSVFNHLWDPSSQDMFAASRRPFGRLGACYRLGAQQIHLNLLSFIYLCCYALSMVLQDFPCILLL